MSDYIVTEYKESIKKAQHNLSNSVVNGYTNNTSDEISYSEDYAIDTDMAAGPDFDSPGAFGSYDDEGYNKDDMINSASDTMEVSFSEDVLDNSTDDVNMMEDMEGTEDDEVAGIDIPGAGRISMADDEPEEEVETDWEKDRDPKHFMVYITQKYPNEIPKHNGNSTLGCERAIHFLNHLNKEISEALRADVDNILDIGKLEEVRVNMSKDIDTLRNHAKTLNKKRKSASEDNGIVKEAEFSKVATTPTIQLVVTPFERAISGIIVNATVSAGKPFEDVYKYLKEKYSLDDREELAIMQLLQDMGHPIFKDRGTYGKPPKKDEKAQGVDFIKNYFA